ncbi:MAG TPA: glycoside hydrolase family 31 protein [Candidatus Marinimicrobia bacterium]|nr:glycoside hydrolase family 31 protein [Candidatus Neomarinimicrobiota bacterium]
MKKWSKILLVIGFLSAESLFAQVIWEKNQYKVYLQDNVLSLFSGQDKIVEISSISFNFIPVDTIIVEQVFEDSLILKLRLAEKDGFHADFPSEINLRIAQSGNTFHFFASHQTFNHITVCLKDQNEHYFGLIEKLYPGNLKNPDLRGNVVDVDVYGLGNLDYAENYASAYSAFFISSQGYGSFFDTFAKGKYKLGIDGITEIYHQTGTLDWYIFYGPTGEKIHSEYYRLIGKPKYIPIWACGPIFWRDQNNGGKDELLNDIQKFNELQIPLTACFIDRPYSNGAHEWSKMDFSVKFAEPEKWIKKINSDYGMQVMTWVGPLTFSDSDFPGLFPDSRNYIDLTNPMALAEFERRLASNQYAVGIKGHKMDRADEHFPLTADWYEPVTETEARNKYVYLYAKTIDKFLRNAHGRDNFNFARAAFHRSQPYLSALWGGDSRNNWYGMAGNMANAIRCGFMGFPVWGNDTGGYLGEGKIDELLYMRWLEWSVWNGMFEIKIDGAGGSGEDRPPWKYSEQLQEVFRNVCQFRMEMLPYIYSCANTSYKNGVLMKPLAYMYPDDENTYTIWDEFIFGSAFLIAPVFSAENERQIYLPQGNWIDYYEPNKEYSGPLTISQSIPLERIPVFIRQNSIYVSGQIYQGNSKTWAGNLNGKENLIIHLYPGEINENTQFTYVDYLDGDTEKTMTLQHQEGKILFSSAAIPIPSVVRVTCSEKPQKVFYGGKTATFKYDKQSKIAEIACPKDRAIKLEIRY